MLRRPLTGLVKTLWLLLSGLLGLNNRLAGQQVRRLTVCGTVDGGAERPERPRRRLLPARLADVSGRVRVSLVLAVGVLVLAAGAFSYFQSSGTGSGTALAGNFTGALDHFVVSAPGSATAGSPFSLTVTAEDAFGHTVNGYTGTVHFTTTDGGTGTSVPADYTLVGATTASTRSRT